MVRVDYLVVVVCYRLVSTVLFVGLVGELLLWSCDQEIFELSDYAI